MSLYIAIDPSLTSTGVVLLKDGELLSMLTIKTEPTETAAQELSRLQSIVQKIFEVVSKYHGKEDLKAVMEAPSYCSKSSAIVQLSGLNYLLRDRFSDWHIPLAIVPPMSLKKFASGKGNSKKEDMKLAVFKRWNFENKSNDIVDSFALAKMAECIFSGTGTEADMEACKKVEII